MADLSRREPTPEGETEATAPELSDHEAAIWWRERAMWRDRAMELARELNEIKHPPAPQLRPRRYAPSFSGLLAVPLLVIGIGDLVAGAWWGWVAVPWALLMLAREWRRWRKAGSDD